MRLIFLVISLVSLAVFAKPAKETAPAAASWEVPDGELLKLLVAGTAKEIGALPGIDAAMARSLVRLRDGRGKAVDLSQIEAFNGLEIGRRDRLTRLLKDNSLFEDCKDGVCSKAGAATVGEGYIGETEKNNGIVDTAGQEDVRLDLNTATVQQLADLPGIGPRMAERIVALRVQKGGFQRLTELRAIEGLDAAKLGQLEKRVVIR